METFTVVRPEHLNHSGSLFGGQLLCWVDEYGWMAAARDFPQCTFTTRAMSDVEFHRQVPCGAILRFQMDLERLGRTSVTYHVKVDSTPHGEAVSETVFSTSITLVNVDSNGQKVPLPRCPYLSSGPGGAPA